MFLIQKLTSPFLFVTFEEKNDFKYASKLFKNTSAERPYVYFNSRLYLLIILKGPAGTVSTKPSNIFLEFFLFHLQFFSKQINYYALYCLQ